MTVYEVWNKANIKVATFVSKECAVAYALASDCNAFKVTYVALRLPNQEAE